MMTWTRRVAWVAMVPGLALAACVGTEPGEPLGGDGETLSVPAEDRVKTTSRGKADASVEATFLTFRLDGHFLTDNDSQLERQIEEQLLYTVGHLNGDNSVARMDNVVLSEVRSSSEAGRTRVDYTAELLVAWGEPDEVPATYQFSLPRDMSFTGQEAFAQAYGHSCVSYGAHDVTSGSMWYYYRPNASRCDLEQDDVVEVVADISPSQIETTGKYPEYHKVWEDDALRVVAVFGKYEDGVTSNSDAGITAYNRFVSMMGRDLAQAGTLTTTPATLPSAPGVATPDVTFEVALDGGRRVEVVALLVDNVRTAGRDFDTRYEALSGRADLIAYNGHSGLGRNIRTLAQKGRWQTGQYAVVFMNGCDTYAYVDTALNDAHAAVNPDDPTGTKYVDLVMNAMPSFFRSMPQATAALIEGLMAFDRPKTYEQIFADIDDDQVILVSGEGGQRLRPRLRRGRRRGRGLAGDEARGRGDSRREPLLRDASPRRRHLHLRAHRHRRRRPLRPHRRAARRRHLRLPPLPLRQPRDLSRGAGQPLDPPRDDQRLDCLLLHPPGPLGCVASLRQPRCPKACALALPSPTAPAFAPPSPPRKPRRPERCEAARTPPR